VRVIGGDICEKSFNYDYFRTFTDNSFKIGLKSVPNQRSISFVSYEEQAKN
jgi:hypothetical protein